MDERSRQHLLTKLKNKERLLQFELDELQRQFRLLGTSSSEQNFMLGIRRELKLIARWMEDFTQYSIDAAKSISPESAALKIASEHIVTMLERFEPHVATLAGILGRSRVDDRDKSRNERAIRKVRHARSTVAALIAEAEFEFQPGSLSGPKSTIAESSFEQPFSDEERRQWMAEQPRQKADSAHAEYKKHPRYDGTNQPEFRKEWKKVKDTYRGRPRL